MRGTSAVIFLPGNHLRANHFPSTIGPVDLTYTSRWINKNANVTTPGHLWIEAKGSGSRLSDVLAPFANAGYALLPVMSLCANTAIGDPELEIGYDSSPNINERDYFQQYVPPESEIAHFTREINVKETVALFDALNSNEEAERIRRAANQYRLALNSWRLGQEALSLAHLWMALEALTKSRIRLECKKRHISTQEELAVSLGVAVKRLDPTVRRVLILKGDNECYKKAKSASDGFEHGFLGFDKIQSLAQDTRYRMAKYIRTEVFYQLGINQEAYDVLTNDPYDKPLGYWPIVKCVRGKLVGENPELAAVGNAYPFLRWKPVIDKCEVKENEEVSIVFSDKFTAEFGEGIGIKSVKYEAWKPE